jgi:soluble lytic murein transglycosylase
MKTTFLSASVLGLGLVVSSLPALAEPPASVPVPAIKPLGFAPTKATPPSFETTGAIPRGERLAAVNPQLKAGLDALSDRDGAEAIAIRNRMPNSLDRQMLTWSIAMSGLRDVPATEIATAQRQLTGWPGLKAFRANSEKALFRENPAPSAVLAAFGDTAPETTEGTMLLARAHLATGDKAKATRLIRTLWRGDALDVATEDRVMAEFSGLLTTADHRARMDYLLYRERASQAKRFSTLGEAQSLYKAWAGLIARSRNVDALISAVDKSWAKDPAYLFIRLENLRRKQEFEAAAKLIEQMPRDPKVLINGGAWWDEQRIVARGLADLGKYREAYRIVSGPRGDRGDRYCGCRIPCRLVCASSSQRSRDREPALCPHPRSLEPAPFSASRAWYWLGRASEVAKDGKARDYFTRAAQHSSTLLRPACRRPYR